MKGRKTYGEPCDTMLRALDADVTSGVVVRKSPEWWARYQAARARSPMLAGRLLEQKAACDRRYYVRHGKGRREAAREYIARNRDRIRQRTARYYRRNRAALLAKQKRYARATRLERAALRLVAFHGVGFTDAVLTLLGSDGSISTLSASLRGSNQA